MPKYENYDCPKCHKGVICVRVFGGALQEKRGAKTSLGKTKTFSRSANQFIVEHDCPKCGEKAEDIEKTL